MSAFLAPAAARGASYGHARGLGVAATSSSPQAPGSASEHWGRLWLVGLVASAFSLRPSNGTGRGGRIVVRGRNYETNIKKKKGPAERRMAQITAKHLRLIVVAMKEGGPDPSVNSQLKRYIQAAIRDNMPRDTIDRRIKAFTDKKEVFDEVEVQGYGPGGTAVVIEAMTDNMNRTRTAIGMAFKEVNGELKNVGDHIFQRLGVIEFQGLDEEKVLEASMEAEAEVEDVVLREDGVVEATTLPENFHSAVNAFEGAGLEPSKAERQIRVQVEAPLNHEQTYEVLRLLYELEECDDVGEVHHNAVLQDDVELKFTQFGKVMEYKKAFPE